MSKLMVLVALTFFSAVTFSEPLAKTYEEALQKSKASDDLIPNGSQEYIELSTSLFGLLGNAAQACKTKATNESFGTVNFVLVISEAGHVVKVYRDKITKYGDCIEIEFLKGRLPKPSIHPLYGRVPITFSG